MTATLTACTRGCQCLRCLASAFGAATAAVSSCRNRYNTIRMSPVSPAVIDCARRQWTAARLRAAAAEDAFRAAEDARRRDPGAAP